MIQNAQFTDPERNKFFFPENAEAEVHPDVDLGVHPSVTVLDIDNPILRIDTGDGKQRLEMPRSINDSYAYIHEGNRLLSVDASTQYAAQYLHFNAIPRDEPSDEAREHAAKVFSSLTHMIVELDPIADYGKKQAQLIEESDFGIDGKSVVLPIGEDLPSFTTRRDQVPLRYKLTAFVNNRDQFVPLTLKRRQATANWLIDMCVANAHSSNRTEVALLANEVGFSSSLAGLLSRHRDVTAYLRHFSAKYPDTEAYYPTTDPLRRLYDMDYFGTTEEHNRYMDLFTITVKSSDKPRQDLTWADAKRDNFTDRG